MSDPQGWLERPVVVRVEDARGRELASTVVEPSHRILDAELSPTGRSFFVRGAERGGEDFFLVRATRGSGGECRRALPPTGPGTAHFEWTPGDNLLHRWSAGTYAAEAALYGSDCARRIELSAAAVDVQPGRRHALAYTPRGAPRTEPRHALIYDLSRGARGPRIEARPGEEITGVTWTDETVEIRLVTGDGSERTVELPLDPPD